MRRHPGVKITPSCRSRRDYQSRRCRFAAQSVRPLSQTTIRTKPRLELTRFDSLAARPSCPFRHSAFRLTLTALQIGRASWRESGGKYVEVTVVAVTLKK